jgi:response regulator of citrate/malate metabolism
MFDEFLKSKRSEKDPLSENEREMDINYIKMAYELEKLRTVNRKIDTINTKLRAFEDVASTNGFEIKPQTMSSKTKDAIRLILQKHKELTSSDLGRLIKLSRTRCTEYLREMENEGILASKINCRKKLYSLRH